MAPNVRGVAVDSDARRVEDPVTRVVWPSGAEQDADDWSEANNFRGMGAEIAEGYPTGPEMVLSETAQPAPGNEPQEQHRPAPAAAPRPATPPPSPSPSS